MKGGSSAVVHKTVQEFNKVVAGNLRFLREEQGLSQDDLAIMTGCISKALIGKIEKNADEVAHSKKINSDHIRHLAIALRTSPSALTEDDDQLRDRFSFIKKYIETIKNDQGVIDTEVLRLINETVELCKNRGARERIQSIHLKSEVDYIRGLFTSANDMNFQALNIAESFGDDSLIIKARHKLARVDFMTGNYKRACDLLDKNLASQNLKRENRAEYYYLRGMATAKLCRWEVAKDNLLKAISEVNDLYNKEQQALKGRCYQALGGLMRDTKNHNDAMQYSRIALEISDSINDALGGIYSLKTIGETLYDEGKTEDALPYFVEAHSRAMALEKIRPLEVLKLEYWIHRCNQNINYLQECLSKLEKVEMPKRDLGEMYLDAARLSVAQGNTTLAFELYERAYSNGSV